MAVGRGQCLPVGSLLLQRVLVVTVVGLLLLVWLCADRSVGSAGTKWEGLPAVVVAGVVVTAAVLAAS